MAYVIDTLPAQRDRVNLRDPREAAWWCKRFGCNQTQLGTAVQTVGTTAALVEQWLDGVTVIAI